MRVRAAAFASLNAVWGCEYVIEMMLKVLQDGSLMFSEILGSVERVSYIVPRDIRTSGHRSHHDD